MRKVIIGFGIIAGVMLIFLVIIYIIASSSAFRYDKYLPTPVPTPIMVIGSSYTIQSTGSSPESENQSVSLMDRPASTIEDPEAKIIEVLPISTKVILLETKLGWCSVKGTFEAQQGQANSGEEFQGWVSCRVLSGEE